MLKGLFLNTISDEILNLGDALIDIYCRETGLPQARAMGERSRTIFQLQLFAKTIETELEKNINEEAIQREPHPKTEFKQTYLPLGPIAVFGASNFPLAILLQEGIPPVHWQWVARHCKITSHAQWHRCNGIRHQSSKQLRKLECPMSIFKPQFEIIRTVSRISQTP